MSSALDLANAANWEQFHYSSRSVIFSNPYTYAPLSELDVSGGILLDTSIIASFASSSSAKPSWKIAGWLNQQIRVGVAVGGDLDAVSQASSRVLLRKTKIHFWRQDINNYGLTFSTPKWIKDLNLTLWKYTGPIEDSIQQGLDLARIDILRTEAKVDALFKDWSDGG